MKQRPNRALCSALLTLVLGACQSAAPAGPTDVEAGLDIDDFQLGLGEDYSERNTGSMVAVDNIEEKYRDLLLAWKQGGFVWEIKRSEALGDPELTTFLVDNLLVLLFEEYRKIQDGIASRGGAATLAKNEVFDRTCKELILCGPPAAEALAETLALSGDMMAKLSKEVLMQMGAAGAPPVSALLNREKAAIRFRAAESLGRLPSAGMSEGTVLERLGKAAQEDASDLVRVKATQSIGERGLWSQIGRPTDEINTEPYRLELETCLENSSEGVRIAASKAMRSLGDRRGIGALIDAATVAGKAERNLELKAHTDTMVSLAGVNHGWDMNKWRLWWRDNKVGIDATRGF
ncbi:MAG: hypothetical protein ACI9D0_002213 [Bacteroidia bacterium]|jgi:hypothetical protein